MIDTNTQPAAVSQSIPAACFTSGKPSTPDRVRSGRSTPSRLPIEPLLRPAQVATILGVHRNTVRNLQHTGALRAVSIGAATRYRPADVRRLIEGA